MNARLVAFGLAAALIVTGCAGGPPELLHDGTVPDDLRTLADKTWDDFLAAVPARQGCIDSPTLRAGWELATRAEYQPDGALVTVRVPGTPATLRSELLHEFAHHVEFTCAAHAELRADFLSAQGFAEDTAWFGGASWEETPSEHYAEAVVELIEGRRTHQGGIRLTDDAVSVVREWGLGP